MFVSHPTANLVETPTLASHGGSKTEQDFLNILYGAQGATLAERCAGESSSSPAYSLQNLERSKLFHPYPLRLHTIYLAT
jgi:hypothetical protein